MGLWLFGFFVGGQIGVVVTALFAARRVMDCEDCPRRHEEP